MNKSHVAACSGTRTRPAVAPAPVRQSLLELDDDEIEEVREDPWTTPAAILEIDESDWTGEEEENAHVGRGHRREAYDRLAPELESELNLMLHGVSYR